MNGCSLCGYHAFCFGDDLDDEFNSKCDPGKNECKAQKEGSDDGKVCKEVGCRVNDVINYSFRQIHRCKGVIWSMLQRATSTDA